MKDITWFKPDGYEMSDEEWHHAYARSLGMNLAGRAVGERDHFGRLVEDDDFLLLLNAHHEEVPVTLPGSVAKGPWLVVIDTSQPPLSMHGLWQPGQSCPVRARSFALQTPENSVHEHPFDTTPPPPSE